MPCDINYTIRKGRPSTLADIFHFTMLKENKTTREGKAPTRGRCKIAAPMTEHARQMYYANHKDVLRRKYLMSLARAQFEEMKSVPAEMPQRPRLAYPPMSDNCPFARMRGYEELYLATAKTMIQVEDAFSKEPWSRKYVHAMLRKCHPDRFATNIYAPELKDYDRWNLAVNHFSSMILNLSATDQAGFRKCLSHARAFIESLKKWEKDCADYERGARQTKWDTYKNCTTFEQFFDKWMSAQDDPF